MNSLKNRIQTALTGVCAGVHYFYPASWANFPCLAWRESGNREFAMADGRERLTEVTYSVDIWSDSHETNEDIAGEVDRRLAAMRLRRDYSADVYETGARLHHRVMRYRALTDSEGNIFQ